MKAQEQMTMQELKDMRKIYQNKYENPESTIRQVEASIILTMIEDELKRRSND